MLQFVIKLWKDSVFSKLIATGIIFAIGYMIKKFSNIDFQSNGSYFISKITISYSIQAWIIALNFLGIITLVVYCVSVNLQKKTNDRNNDEIELTEDDILVKIVSWWPNAEGMSPEDVSVDFEKLEKELSLPRRSVAKYIDHAARLNNYTIKVRSQNNAVYEYDMDGVF